MDKIQIGIISKPQGIKGELKIKPLTDDINRFKLLKNVYMNDKKVKIVSCRISQNEVFLFLDGIADRNAAELVRNTALYIDKTDAVSLPKDRYFIVDILGCTVTDSDSQPIGKVIDILQNRSADVYVLDTNIMFPFLNDLVIDVDIVNKIIIVDKKRFEEVAVYED